jgi:hypothetical protein
MVDRPPIYTVLVELAGWTFDRTASIPKSQRFTFGQRLDNLTLDALMLVVKAIYSPAKEKARQLSDLNLLLEQLRVLWRLVQERRWISQQQLLFVNGKIDEVGRMAGGWLKQVEGRRGGA